MPNLNKVLLIGHTTRDAELKYTPKGTAVAETGLAINHTYKVGEEKREEVVFVDVTFWGRTAEVVSEYAKKGKAILVEGRLQLDTWDDKQTGQKRSKLRVVADSVQLLGDSKKQGASSSAPSDKTPPADPDLDDETIPY